MDVKEDKKEQEYSGNENSLMRKGKQTLKDKAKKFIIKKAIALLVAKLLLPIIILSSIFGGIVFLAGAEYLTDDDTEESTNNAKTQSIATTYSPNASVTQTDENGNTINKVIVTANASGNGYEIKYNNDAEYIKALRKKLEANSIVESVAGFTDLEIAVIGSLYESGAHLEAYTDEALKCLATFIKAEAGTSNLDLRPNSEKYDSSGNYVPKKIEDLAENEVPGVINLIRTNTNGGITKLEYKTENDFNGMKDANDPNVLNYFTINSNGELVYAKWKQIKVSKISGEYPENLPESEKLIEEDTYIYELDKIPYTEIVKGYTIPFEFLNQLLIITKEPDFCMELVDYVLDSKIEINILEEQTITDEIETIDYIIHNKEEKYINYTLADTTKYADYLLIGKVDDYGKECTTYNRIDTYNYDDSAKVKIKRVRTEHTYKYEISEVDTMFVKIINKFDYSAVAGPIKPEQLPPEDPLRTNNQYQQGEIIVYTDSDKISEDENVKTFKEENDISSVDTLIIKPYSKINTDSYIEKSVIKYSAKTETPTTYYYAKDANGNYEKFLVAYNNSKGAQNNINSIDSWLYEMVEENEATVKLEKYLKYVLSVYDGKDRGVTEGELDVFEKDEFISTAPGAYDGRFKEENLKEVENIESGEKLKIFLSPENDITKGHTLTDGTNQWYSEKENMWQLASILKGYLEEYENVEVVIPIDDGRTGYSNRGNEAKEAGCNLYIALHSNGAGSDATVPVNGPVCFYYYKSEQSRTLASNIGNNLKELMPDYLKGENRKSIKMLWDAWDSKMAGEIIFPSQENIVSVLIEHEFHDNDEGAKYIMDNLEKIAKADAIGVATTFGLKKK